MSTRNDEAMVEWSWKTWQCIFQLQRLSGEQLVLAFKALKRLDNLQSSLHKLVNKSSTCCKLSVQVERTRPHKEG